MLIDTHCHLDAAAFDDDRNAVIQRARDARVQHIVIPAVAPYNFSAVRDLAHAFPGGAYALGIHPIAIRDATTEDLTTLERAVEQAVDDPHFVGIGEIGLDLFIPELKTPEMRDKQEAFYQTQLKLAQRHGLPVILHVRRSQDRILKYLRRHPELTGIAHAFNGSFHQAKEFLDLGFVLGAGGAMTFTRARQIRRLASELPLESWVLETDAPDIPPAWLTGQDHEPPRNEPAEVAGVARILAELRQTSIDDVLSTTSGNVRRVLPRLFS